MGGYVGRFAIVVSVLIADDHPPFARGLERLLADEPDLECAGVAGDGEEAVGLACELRPDVVVMDVALPRVNGIEATRRIKESTPGVAVLVLSAYGYYPYVTAALDAGAGGYLLKNTPLRELMNAIRALPAGEAVLEQSVAEKVLRSLARGTGDDRSPSGLTGGDVELLTLAARGLGNKEIASRLSLSERSVQARFTEVFGRLGVGSRIEAVVRAMREGWLSPDELP